MTVSSVCFVLMLLVSRWYTVLVKYRSLSHDSSFPWSIWFLSTCYPLLKVYLLRRHLIIIIISKTISHVTKTATIMKISVIFKTSFRHIRSVKLDLELK